MVVSSGAGPDAPKLPCATTTSTRCHMDLFTLLGSLGPGRHARPMQAAPRDVERPARSAGPLPAGRIRRVAVRPESKELQQVRLHRCLDRDAGTGPLALRRRAQRAGGGTPRRGKPSPLPDIPPRGVRRARWPPGLDAGARPNSTDTLFGAPHGSLVADADGDVAVSAPPCVLQDFAEDRLGGLHAMLTTTVGLGHARIWESNVVAKLDEELAGMRILSIILMVLAGIATSIGALMLPTFAPLELRDLVLMLGSGIIAFLWASGAVLNATVRAVRARLEEG